MTIDVTKIFETYREASRHLRNTFFSTRDSGDWDVIGSLSLVPLGTRRFKGMTH